MATSPASAVQQAREALGLRLTSGGRDRLVTLTVADGVACGPIGGEVAFMQARSQSDDPWSDWPDTGETEEIDHPPVEWHDIGQPLTETNAFVVGLLVPGITFRLTGGHDDADGWVLWLRRLDAAASIGYGKGRPITVAGNRCLIDDYMAAVRWWHDQDRPRPEQFGLRVALDKGPARQEVWFRSPAQLVPLP
ncbi:hypothetical protein OG948_15435 [Embleya sp. NBC_00888]|uniref:hypothetical protein n=1 Tax=Embleya sp. NBC_00888 TaxID=2975960 RepID=UPI0038690DF3|nr:hypothetical protein OG948_15435 [Embleya sp. NBC_00888]